MQIRPLNLRKALLEENDPGALGMIPMLPPIIDDTRSVTSDGIP